MRRTTLALLATACLTLAGCSNSSDSKADAKPTPSHTPTATTYTIDDCKALLEQYYQDNDVHDAEGETECRGLTHGQYTEAVTAVMKEHVDDIMSDAADKTMYDQVWGTLDADTRTSVCDTMTNSSPDAVGALLNKMVTDPSVDTTKMAQYFYDEKC